MPSACDRSCACDREDRIHLEKLVVYAHHGYFEEEAKLGQKFMVTLTLYQSFQSSAQRDDLTQTTHYGIVAEAVTEFLTHHRYRLLESCAEKLASFLFDRFPAVSALDLRLHKPWAPIGLPIEDVWVEIHRARHQAFIALGSNLGDRKAYLDQALTGLRAQPRVKVLAVSSYLETAPYGPVAQDPFLNAVCQVETTLSPEALLDVMQALEEAAQRKRTLHWGPRTLDLDLLFYDQAILGTDRLVVPHPDLENRFFVLQPLCELAPHYRHPISHRTMAQLLEDLEARTPSSEGRS